MHGHGPCAWSCHLICARLRICQYRRPGVWPAPRGVQNRCSTALATSLAAATATAGCAAAVAAASVNAITNGNLAGDLAGDLATLCRKAKGPRPTHLARGGGATAAFTATATATTWLCTMAVRWRLAGVVVAHTCAQNTHRRSRMDIGHGHGHGSPKEPHGLWSWTWSWMSTWTWTRS